MKALPVTLVFVAAGILLLQVAQQWYTLQGLLYYTLGELEPAARRFERALERDADNLYASLYLGQVQLKRHHYEAAASTLSRITQRVPAHHQAFNLLAGALASAGNFDAAITAARRAVELRPGVPEYIHQLGRVYKDAGMPARSRETLLRIYDENTANRDLLYDLAYASRQLGERKDALAYLRLAAARYGGDGEVYLELARSLRALGRSDEARSAYNRAATLLPDDFFAAYEHATLLSELGRADAALAELNRAVALDPHYPELAGVFYSLVFLFKDAARVREAIATLDQAIARQPDNAEYHYQRGLLLRRQGDPEGALRSLRKAAALGLNHAELQLSLGLLMVAFARDEDAEAYFRQTLVLEPGHAYAHAELARIYARRNDLDAAISEFRRDLLNTPDDFFSHYDLGRLLLQIGELEDARGHLEIALSLDPGYPHTCAALHEVYSALGQSRDYASGCPPLPQ